MARSVASPRPSPPADRPGPATGFVRAVGIDPGATTALVCLDVPVVVPRVVSALSGARFDVDGARWVASAIVRPSASAKLTTAEAKATLYGRALDALVGWAPALVVLEEPLDASDVWASQTRRVSAGRGRSTSFLLGQHYGLVLAAARAASGTCALASYPVNNWDGRPGWMQGGAGRPQRRDDVLGRLVTIARSLGGPADLSEDGRCALGVLLYHLGHADAPSPREAAA